MIKPRMSPLLTCLAATTVLFAVAITPALAHHRTDHEQGTGNTSTEENYQQADQEASDSSSQESSSQESTAERSSITSSRETSGGTQRDPEPDPEPSQAPPSTKGPGDCDAYSGSQGGPYDHDNCDGSQGMAGSDGNGKCAGCTGKADDKGPGGQHPGDHNNGYECDNNGGVGKGNPAHSRCPKPVVVTSCPPGSAACPITPPCPPGSAACPNDVEVRTDKVCPEDTDFAGQDMTSLKDCVLGTRFHNSGPAPEPDQPLGAILPFTGTGDIYPVMAIGLLLIALGSIILRLRNQV